MRDCLYIYKNILDAPCYQNQKACESLKKLARRIASDNSLLNELFDCMFLSCHVRVSE